MPTVLNKSQIRRIVAIEKRFNAHFLKLDLNGVVPPSFWPTTMSTSAVLLKDKIITSLHLFADLFFEYLIDINAVRYRSIAVTRLIKNQVYLEVPANCSLIMDLA